MISGVSLIELEESVLELLKDFAKQVNSEVIVTSAYRPGDSGQHGEGLAIDVVVPAYAGRLLDLFFLAERQGWVGIGVYPKWQAAGKIIGGLHLDIRHGPTARWMGLGSGKQQQYVALNQENLKKHGVI